LNAYETEKTNPQKRKRCRGASKGALGKNVEGCALGIRV
jgi:hypothetical protein